MNETSRKATAGMPLQIGPRLKDVRTMRRQRLKEVAARVGCSESLISKIENGKALPSLTMLHRIVDALGTNISALFDARDDHHGPVMRAGTRPVIATDQSGQHSRIRYERLIPYREGRLLQGSIHIVEPGCGSDGNVRHEGEEVGYVLAGSIELTIEGQAYSLQPGDSFVFRSELFHSYRNTGDAVARIIWINTPPSF